MGVEGNKKADKVAEEAAEGPGVQRCPERFVSHANIGRTLSEKKWKEAMHWFRVGNARRPSLQRAKYDLALESKGQDTERIRMSALMSRPYFRSKSGHALRETDLHLIGKTVSDQCWKCTSKVRMDTHRVMLSCSAWTDERRKMRERWEKDGGVTPGQ